MTTHLPLRDFRWMTEEEIASFNPLTDCRDEEGPGYIVECDLEYPEHLHYAHNSFPLAAENISITEQMLSPYSRKCLQEVYGKRKQNSQKLTATFYPRKKYLLHGLNLKYYLEKGLLLGKIHRIITFHQAPFIKPFIDFCTVKRREAKTESEKQYWKLAANSLYGKMIEGVANRMDVR